MLRALRPSLLSLPLSIPSVFLKKMREGRGVEAVPPPLPATFLYKKYKEFFPKKKKVEILEWQP